MGMSVREIGRATLARQLLLERHDLPAVQAVERLAGMQGQEPKHPYAGLWTRLEGFRTEELDDAVEDRKLVRATMMRGTLHLMSAKDYLAFRMTLEPVLAGGLSVLADRSEGVEPDEVVKAARELLDKDGPMRFTAIRKALTERFPGLNDRALGYTTRMLVPLVMVPDGSRWGYPANAPFTLADSWLGKQPAKRQAPEKLVERYLAAVGPATPADFQTWSGLQARPVFDKLRDRLDVLKDADGKDLYDLPDAPRPGDVDAPVRFLPEFDNILLSHTKRNRIIADEHKPAVFTKNLRVKATYLVDGLVAGLWTTSVKRGVATLTLEPFGKLTKKTRTELEAEGERLLRFLEPAAKSYQVE